jgi:hypothetical protein
MSGASGAGKTTVATAMGYAIANGKPFAGLATEKRPVLVLDRENPVAVVVERLDRLRITNETGLTIWGGWCPSEPPGPASYELVEWVVSCDPRPVLIFDSLIGFYTGQSENDSAEVRRYMQAFRKLADLGCTVLALHHSGKGESTKDFRGSSDIKASVDTAWHLANFGEGRLDRLRLRAYKCRFAVAADLLLRYVEGQFSIHEAVTTRTVSELLGDLLRSNPGIRSADFEKLAVDKDLGRDRARAYLEDGILAGHVRREKGRNNAQMHYLVQSEGAQ